MRSAEGEKMARTKDQLAEALVAPSTVDKKQFLQIFELRDSDIRGSCCLQAFDPRDTDANVRSLYHADIVGTIANGK